MKHTGIIRTVDALGRIVIPIELRHALELQTGDELEIMLDDNRIVLQKFSPCCIFCGSRTRLRMFCNRLVCYDCMTQLSSVK